MTYKTWVLWRRSILTVQLQVEQTGDVDAGDDVSVPERVQSRAERKSRKSMQNIGLKPVPGIKRVTLRRPRGVSIERWHDTLMAQHLFVVSEPDVYKSPVSDAYIVFGEVKSEDMSAMAQAQAAQQMMTNEQQNPNAGAVGAGGDQVNFSDIAASKQKQEEEEEDDGAPIDEEGVDQKDIDLVMEQVRLEALREHVLTRALRCAAANSALCYGTTGLVLPPEGCESSQGERWRPDQRHHECELIA